jgi:hypothetical protein
MIMYMGHSNLPVLKAAIKIVASAYMVKNKPVFL